MVLILCLSVVSFRFLIIRQLQWLTRKIAPSRIPSPSYPFSVPAT
jgi:hypothetical protein